MCSYKKEDCHSNTTKATYLKLCNHVLLYFDVFVHVLMKKCSLYSNMQFNFSMYLFVCFVSNEDGLLVSGMLLDLYDFAFNGRLFSEVFSAFFFSFSLLCSLL